MILADFRFHLEKAVAVELGTDLVDVVVEKVLRQHLRLDSPYGLDSLVTNGHTHGTNDTAGDQGFCLYVLSCHHL